MTPTEFGEYIDELVERLQPLGEGAADLGGQAFELAVRQSYVVGIIWGGVTLFGALLVGLTFWCLLQDERVNKDVERHSDRDDKWEIIAAAAGVLGGFGLIIGAIGFLSTGLPQLLNPHWYGLERILSTLGLG